eukprot:SAG11_NODE_1351_length_5135_cov_2.092931_3_plen_603_part_00
MCLARGDVCAEPGPTWLEGSTCIGGSCACTSNGHDEAVLAEQLTHEGSEGEFYAVLGCSRRNIRGCLGVLEVCLGDDMATSLGTNSGADGHVSPTIYVWSGVLTLDCGKGKVQSDDAGEHRCLLRDRLHIDFASDEGDETAVTLSRLRFADLHAGRGGAIKLGEGAQLSVFGCAFERNVATAVEGGAISAYSYGSITISNRAAGTGGAIHALGGSLTISLSRFESNGAAPVNSAAISGQIGWYTNEEANAAFGGAAGRRLLSSKNESTNSLPMKNDDSKANQYHITMGHLAALDIDPALKNFIQVVVIRFEEQMKQVENANAALQQRTQVVEKENAAFRAELVQVQKRTKILEVKNKAIYSELEQVTNDKAILEIKTQMVEAELRQVKVKAQNLQTALLELASRTKGQVHNITLRLDQCEIDTHPFIAEVYASQRRRMQEEETLCRGSGLAAMFEACCPSGTSGNGHRILQLTEGCDSLPETCSASCAPLFIEYFEGCQAIIDDLAPDQRQMFVGFYGGCQEVEQAAAAMLEDARPAMIFHVVVLNEAAAQQAQMFGGGSAPAPPIGPIGPLPPSPNPAGGAEIAQEFRRHDCEPYGLCAPM